MTPLGDPYPAERASKLLSYCTHRRCVPIPRHRCRPVRASPLSRFRVFVEQDNEEYGGIEYGGLPVGDGVMRSPGPTTDRGSVQGVGPDVRVGTSCDHYLI